MSDFVSKRMVGRPRSTLVGLQERMKRYQVAERCAELTPEIIAFWARVVRNENLPIVLRMQAADRLMDRAYGRPRKTIGRFSLRMQAADRLMDRAYGRPPVAMEIDATNPEMSPKKVVHIVKWLPPDPNDHSKVIEPEP
jgi:hypothetical protein